MHRYFLELAYKGTGFKGFQIQSNAETIQGEIEKALHIIFRIHITLTTSSRTDAGVHANQNFFHFDIDLSLNRKHLYSLNALISKDICILNLYEVDIDRHSRFHADSRTYQYFIYQKKNPFLYDRAWYYPFKLDLNQLQLAASTYLEYEDFASFSKKETQVKTTLCNIISADWSHLDDKFVFTVTANRFLRGMVRALVGTSLKVGRGTIDMDCFKSIIEAKDNRLSDFSAPAHGLFLQKVHYPFLLNPIS